MTAPDGTSVPLFPELATDPPRAAFRFVDLFAGIGGIRLGLERVGGSCVYTVEHDKWAVTTYRANHATDRGTDVAPLDIYDVEAKDIPAYDVLAAGFPCQPFSIAGVSKNLALGRQHGFGHATSGNLFFEIVRLIDEADEPPPILLLENVKHLRRHDGGRTFKVIMATLDDRGYNVASEVIDAKPWVPQHRERTFIVGVHRDHFGERTFDFGSLEPVPPQPWPTMDRVLERGIVDPKYTLTPHLWQYLRNYADKHRAAGNGFGFGLVNRRSVARTLSARYHKDGSEILVEQKALQPRRLTPRECARLMGYPDTFTIPVSDTQAYRQFGNSVVVPVVEHVARGLVTQGFLPLSDSTQQAGLPHRDLTAR